MSSENAVDWSYGFEPGVAKRLFSESRISRELSPTIRAKMGDNQVAVAYGIDLYNQTMTGNTSKTLNSVRSDSDHVPCVLILNPSDSQGNQIADSNGIYPTLRGCGGAGYQQGYVFDKKDDPSTQ